jgi:hypothetical protein
LSFQFICKPPPCIHCYYDDMGVYKAPASAQRYISFCIKKGYTLRVTPIVMCRGWSLTPIPTPPLTSNSPPPPDMDITSIEQNELQLLRCKPDKGQMKYLPKNGGLKNGNMALHATINYSLIG